MPQSKRYRTMEAQIKKLGKHYLNFKPRPLGDYTDRQLSSGAAFTVFAHAEFESFVESWAGAILSRCEDRWNQGEIDRSLAYLLFFREKGSAPGQIPKTDVWSAPCRLAIRAHEDVIDKNNGVKESHLCNMFAPMGFDVRKFSEIMLGDLTAFSKMRGDHAHQSYKQHIGQQFDPFDRQVKARKIVVLLKDFDDEMIFYFSNT